MFPKNWSIEMRTRVLVLILLAMPIVGFVGAPQALTADQVRGGWIADLNGQRHVYVLNVRGTDIKGIYCWDCSNPDNLAFVQNGKLEADAISFVVFHDIGPGAPYRENVRGKLVNGQLVLTATRQGGPNARPIETTWQRESRRPGGPGGAAPLPGAAPAAAPPPAAALPPATAPNAPPRGAGPGGGGGGRGRGYVPPGPNEPITVAKISGVWVGGGNGPNKQWFMFRQVDGQILGMVCGPCDNPFTFGVLNDGRIMGDTFTFNIVHEDWGVGIEDGPFNNVATVTIAKNEFRMRTLQDNRPVALEMILTGPLRLDR
jgi:hypothetical protein